ncbi:MAG TPA: hypothetical protein VGH19_06540 [Verrucomicrobiae bacterium]
MKSVTKKPASCRAKWELLSHDLLGCRVLHEGSWKWVTGARRPVYPAGKKSSKPRKDICFRLFHTPTKREEWFGPAPLFHEVQWPEETPVGAV